MPLRQLWSLNRVDSRSYPVTNIAVVHTPQTSLIDLKKILSDQFVSELYVRVQGNIVKAGAGVGTLTGRENPEAIIRTITARHSPSLGVTARNALSVRGIMSMGIFDRGHAIRTADITDAAATVAVDFWLPLVSKMPGARAPIEFGLPMGLFNSYQLAIDCGGREQLFTGGTNTWDLSGLQIQIWGNMDNDVRRVARNAQGQVTSAGFRFNLMEEFEDIVPVLQTRTDLPYELPAGAVYTHLLFVVERDDVVVDDILNNVHIVQGGKVWMPQGETNALAIRRWNQEYHVDNAAEVLTGLYYIPCMRDGMITRALDCSVEPAMIKFDVTLGAGTVRRVTVHGRRVSPQALRTN